MTTTPTCDCPACRRSLRYVPEYQGQTVACPYCHSVFIMLSQARTQSLTTSPSHPEKAPSENPNPRPKGLTILAVAAIFTALMGLIGYSLELAGSIGNPEFINQLTENPVQILTMFEMPAAWLLTLLVSIGLLQGSRFCRFLFRTACLLVVLFCSFYLIEHRGITGPPDRPFIIATLIAFLLIFLYLGRRKVRDWPTRSIHPEQP